MAFRRPAPISSPPATRARRSTIDYTYATAVSYVPDLTPIYDLGRPRLCRREGATRTRCRSRASIPSRCRRSNGSSACRAPMNMRPTPVEARDQIADRALRRAGRHDHPGARDLRRDQRRADRRPDHSAAPALCARAFHVQAVVGILPARSDGRGDDQRRQSRARRRRRCASSRSRRTTRACSPSPPRS